MKYEMIEEMLEQKAINGEHVHVKRHRDEKYSTCICGKVWWAGNRWSPMPDRSLYEDALAESGEAMRKARHDPE